MVSVLPSSTLTDLFLLSYHLHHLPLCVSKLASVWLGIPGSEESPGIASRDFQFVLIILTSLPPDAFPGARSLAAGLGFPDSSVRLRCPEKESPLSSRQAFQVLQIFPVDVSMPGVGLRVGGVGSGRKRGWKYRDWGSGITSL